MKMLVTALVAISVMASPALARTTIEHLGSAINSAWQTSPDSVYSGGEYRGTDPDPQVRLDLRRESPHGGD